MSVPAAEPNGHRDHNPGGPRPQAEALVASGSDPVHAHCRLLHHLAQPYTGRGKLVLACFGEDPATGGKFSPLVRHFEIGDAGGMAAAVHQRGGERNRNLYIPFAVMRPDLRAGAKGFERDVAAVLALVAGFDDAAAADYPTRLPLPPDYVLETSPGRFQAFYLLDEPAAVAEAKPVAAALKRFASCDHSTADMCHVWRIPGTLNHPTKKKLDAGRPREPVPVRVAEAWTGTLTKLDDLRAELEVAAAGAMTGTGLEESAAAGSNGHDHGAEADFTLLFADLPEGLRRRIVEPTPEGQRSDAIHFVVCALLEHGVALDRIEALIRAHPGGIGEKYIGRPDLGRQVERIAAKWRAKGEGGAIQLKAGELHTVTAAAAGVLGRAAEADPFAGYYRRENMLVRATRLADAAELDRAGVRRARGALAIAAADPDALRLALTAATRWERFDGRSEEWVPTDAPAAVARSLLATATDWAAIPILTGIVEAPSLRPDGTVLARPGYDPATGLLFDPGGVEFPPVPERPTRAEALAALQKLTGILDGFPFVDDASRSVAVSGLVTPLVRKACRAVPLYVLTAPKMASGKTLLATLPAYIATGRAPAMMAQADDPADERKRLLAVLIEGHGIVVIDNVERELKSDALCSVLTEPTFSARLLGASKTVRAPSCATFYATGNNLVLAGDLTARAVACAIDPGIERPEEREFAVDLHKLVPERRGELAAAALTIVRAYLAAGEPEVNVPNFARFEDWSRFVRRPLVWLGMADPCAGRERIEGRDPVRARLGALLDAWRRVFGSQAVTTARAVDEVAYGPGGGELTSEAEARDALREALVELAGDRGGISARAVGKFIAKHEGRVEGGRRFVRQGDAQRAALWSVEE